MKNHISSVNIFAKIDDILMKNTVKNILQYFPIVKINEARVAKTEVVEVFFKLLVFGISKSCFHERFRILKASSI